VFNSNLTASSADSYVSIEIERDGGPFQTIQLAGSQLGYLSAAISFKFEQGDTFTLFLTDAGGGPTTLNFLDTYTQFIPIV
jgi:hypothetical protein